MNCRLICCKLLFWTSLLRNPESWFNFVDIIFHFLWFTSLYLKELLWVPGYLLPKRRGSQCQHQLCGDLHTFLDWFSRAHLPLECLHCSQGLDSFIQPFNLEQRTLKSWMFKIFVQDKLGLVQCSFLFMGVYFKILSKKVNSRIGVSTRTTHCLPVE